MNGELGAARPRPGRAIPPWSWFVAVSVLVAIVAWPSETLAGPASPRGTMPVKMVPAGDDVTVSWQVRSGATVPLRLYRTFPDGSESLVGEFVAEPGLRMYRHVDDRRPPGNFVYQLRAVELGGAEVTLGSVICVETGVSPPLESRAPESSGLTAWTATQLDPTHPEEQLTAVAPRLPPDRVDLRPEPPVPRSHLLHG